MRVYQFRHVGTDTTSLLLTQTKTPQSSDYGESMSLLIDY